jgi:hypothetical protein
MNANLFSTEMVLIMLIMATLFALILINLCIKHDVKKIRAEHINFSIISRELQDQFIRNGEILIELRDSTDKLKNSTYAFNKIIKCEEKKHD